MFTWYSAIDSERVCASSPLSSATGSNVVAMKPVAAARRSASVASGAPRR